MDRVAEGRWPALSSLTLGAFGYNSDFTLAAPPEPAFTTFLAMHPTLTYIRFAWNFKRWMSPEDPMALAFPPALESFSGIMQQLPDGGCSNLTTLDLMSEPLYATRAPALCSALRVLPMLTNLELWVHVPEPRAGHEAFFRGLWGAAPGLEDLHFMCTTAFGKVSQAFLAFFLHPLHTIFYSSFLPSVAAIIFLLPFRGAFAFGGDDLILTTDLKHLETALRARTRAAAPSAAADVRTDQRAPLRRREHAALRSARVQRPTHI
jgi:hypothetical protein